MAGVDAGVVFLPRFTTLVGKPAADFATAPLDVSQQGGAQFQVWSSGVRVSTGTGTLSLYLEESLDCQTWVLGPSASGQIFNILPNTTQFFAYDFRLRWFRLRFKLGGTNPIATCWAEGLLRGGEGGMWGQPVTREGTAAGQVSGRAQQQADPWLRLRGAYQGIGDNWPLTVQDERNLLRIRLQAEAEWRAAHGNEPMPPPPHMPNPPGPFRGGAGMGAAMVQGSLASSQDAGKQP